MSEGKIYQTVLKLNNKIRSFWSLQKHFVCPHWIIISRKQLEKLQNVREKGAAVIRIKLKDKNDYPKLIKQIELKNIVYKYLNDKMPYFIS